jgi:hypothetical protein
MVVAITPCLTLFGKRLLYLRRVTIETPNARPYEYDRGGEAVAH